MAPKVSVLLPTYNRIRWLRQAVESVLAQSVDLELLILDNGGSDGSWELLQTLKEQDGRIRLFRREENCAADAYKYLLMEAHGDYAAFFADDDEMLPEGLTRKAAVLDGNPNLGFVWSPVRAMDVHGVDHGEPALWVKYPFDVLTGATTFDMLMAGNHVPMPATLFRREVPNLAQGPFEEIGPAGDWNVWLSALRHFDAAYLREATVRLRFHGGQVTHEAGFSGEGFLKGQQAVWRYWMLQADPPYVPSPTAWRGMLNTQAQTAAATYGQDQEKARKALDQLVALRLEQQRSRMASGPATRPAREAFLFDPDWRGSTWVKVVLGYVQAFEPGEPVGLLIPLDPGREDLPTLAEAQEAVLQVIALTKRETFPDIVFLESPKDWTTVLEGYDRGQWVQTHEGPLMGVSGPNGTRLALACEALARRSES